MEESLAKQRESVARQKAALRAQLSADAPTAAEEQEPFFTVPWSQPVTWNSAVAALRCDPVPKERIGPLVAEISGREGLAPDLLRAVIEKESSYLPCAISAKGALGLMQLMPETASALGIDDVFDPRENLEGGAKFLRQLLTRYEGNLPLALAAYNAGPARVDAAGGMPLIPETLSYVSEILRRLRPQ